MKNNSVEPNKWLSSIINPKGRMPVGVSSFRELATENYTFIDKSLFIKEILDAGDKVILITRPRRFGKTLNINMLYAFFVEKNSPNDPFEGLAIQRAGGKYQQERGKRPVLYLSFKDIKASTWEGAFKQIRTLLAMLVDFFLQEKTPSEMLLPTQRILKAVRREQVDSTDCQDTLVILTELLTIQYGEKPWILIDEYDTPMQTAYQYGFYKEMRDLMRGLLGKALKDNNYLHKGVITGIVRIAKEDVFSGLNNLGTYGVLERKFAQHFGFTQEEVDALLEQKELSEHKEKVKNWYNGYQFGEDTIYNPWSIINFVNNEERIPKLYWVNTSSNHLVHTLLSKAGTTIKKGLQQLLDKESDYTTLQYLQEYTPLGELKNRAENIWGILLASGYLTIASPLDEMIPSRDNGQVKLRIPNEEVFIIYTHLVRSWLEGSGSTSGHMLIDSLLSNDLESFTEDFPHFFRESASYFDADQNQPEKFYHGFIVGMLQHLRNQYSVFSQRESGGGRYDLALIPKDKKNPGFVFEFKRSPKKGTLEEIQAQLEAPAKAALQQIKDRGYITQLFQEDVQNVHILGFAFSGKDVCVVFESLHKQPQND